MAAPALLSAPPLPPPMDEDGVTPHVRPSPTPPPPERGLLRGRPPIRVTSEFDGERQLFSHRLSFRILDGLAKLRLRVNHGAAGGSLAPEVALMARNFSVVVDTASRGAVLRGAANLAGSLRLRAAHNTKEGLGEVAVTTNLGDLPCKIELSSLVPPDGLPRATFVFPNGEVSVKEKKLDEGEKILSVNGLLKSHVLNGVCTALYNDNVMNIKYRYKDDELSFIPSLTLPSNALSFTFKRQLTPSDKFSYRYHFDTNYWSTVYKGKASKHVKWKAGYESDERLGWASLWVAKALIELFGEMIFVHGFVHGDPHPGNILVSPQGQGKFSLVLLDHGIYKELDPKFRLDYCKLWRALILLDTQKILELGEQFGVGKYAKYFPLIFTGRTIDSKSALGTQISGEEKMRVKQDLSSLGMDDISSFMESLPPDFLVILRTDGLLRSILGNLGAPRHVRLLAYAKCAIYGLEEQSRLESGAINRMSLRIKTNISYLLLRIVIELAGLLVQFNDCKHKVMNKLRWMLQKISLGWYRPMM